MPRMDFALRVIRHDNCFLGLPPYGAELDRGRGPGPGSSGKPKRLQPSFRKSLLGFDRRHLIAWNTGRRQHQTLHPSPPW
jgi:hypothetical protein